MGQKGYAGHSVTSVYLLFTEKSLHKTYPLLSAYYLVVGDHLIT